ncbi:hypothetical protein ACFL7D_10010 [candidate division KSB1 bacterium]
MAKAARRRVHQKKTIQKRTWGELPFTKTNYVLLIAGIAVLTLGYYFMSIGPADSFWSLSLSPVVLVVGYAIVIPLAFLYKGKSKVQTEAQKPGSDTP